MVRYGINQHLTVGNMGYRVSGILKLPDGTPANNAEIEFISRKNFSPLVQELKSNMLCGPTGDYDVTLEYGEYTVIVYPGGTYPAAIGTITLAADAVSGQDLPTLLQQAGWHPATPEYVQQIQAWLSQASSLTGQSSASAAAAKTSETNAKASETSATASAATATAKAAEAAAGATAATSKASEATTAASTATTKAAEAASSASSALTSKNAAATSATTASAAATTASTKAGEAATSAANAASSAASAANAITAHEAKAGAHGIAGVTGLQEALNSKVVSVNGKTGAVTLSAADITGVVGSVSSGAIIERGSNANGEYVKFADGTMVCCLSNFNIPETALSANFSRVCNLPAVFASIDGMKPAASVLSTNSGNLVSAGELYRNGFSLVILSGSQINFAGYTYSSPIQTPLTIGIQVIGRWS